MICKKRNSQRCQHLGNRQRRSSYEGKSPIRADPTTDQQIGLENIMGEAPKVRAPYSFQELYPTLAFVTNHLIPKNLVHGHPPHCSLPSLDLSGTLKHNCYHSAVDTFNGVFQKEQEALRGFLRLESDT